MTDLLVAHWDGYDLCIEEKAERFISEGEVVINKNWTVEQVLRLTQAEYNRSTSNDWYETDDNGECTCGGYHGQRIGAVAEPMLFGGANGLWSQVVR